MLYDEEFIIYVIFTTLNPLLDRFLLQFVTGSEMMKNKLLPVLKELLRRGGIKDEQYSTLIEEFDKL